MDTMAIVRCFVVAALLWVVCAVNAQAPSPTLKTGDPAPAFEVAKWLRGPVPVLNDGKVHVIEFWATWCEPCKEGMPHLSNLARKYAGQADFTGVAVWENGDNQLAGVEKFIAHAGDSVTYNLAFAGEGNSPLSNAWLRAAGVRGIPSASIVDKHGRIAWIGHPGEGLEDALKLALDDKLTPAAAAKVDADYKEKLKGADARSRQIQAAATAGDTAKLRELLREETDFRYSSATSLVPDAYVTLANAHPAAAPGFAAFILEEYGNAPRVMMAIASAITGEKSRIKSSPDVAFASKAMSRAASCMEVDQDFNILAARTAFVAKDYAAAVERQSAAVEDARAFQVSVKDFGQSDDKKKREMAPLVQKGAAMQVAAFEKTLEEYKSASAQHKTAPAAALNIGDSAPSLKVDRWYKGAAVPAFERGRIYVVEFWATWCGPCKEAIPHITELARKYKDTVTVAGVSVAEEGNNVPARIEKFVAGMGEKMDYHVAGDSTDGYMYKNWIQAAGENSIPFTVIVDGKGKVAWMGTPAGLETPLQQLIAGTYDLQAARKQRTDLKTGRATVEAALKKINDAIRARDFDAAAAAIRSALASGSPHIGMSLPDIFPRLAALDAKRGYEELKALQGSGYRDAVSTGLSLLVDADGLSQPIYQIGIDEIIRTSRLENQRKNSFVYHMLATGYSRIGAVDQAIAAEEKALALLADDPGATGQDKESYETALAKYKDQQDDYPVSWNVSSEQIAPRTYRIKCEATIKEPFHIYPQRSSGGDGGMGMPTEFLFAEDENMEFSGPVEEKGREKKAGEDLAYYARGVTFTQTVKLKSDKRTQLSFTVKYMACNDVMCLPPTKKQFTLTINPN